MLTSIKNKANLSFALTSLIYAGTLVFETTSANAASLPYISCEASIVLGDVVQDGCSSQMTTDALNNENTPFEEPPGTGQSAPDEVFNLSGNPALDASELEAELGLMPGALSPSLFVQAQHGSAVKFRINNISDKPLAVTINWILESTEPNIAPPNSIPGLPDDFDSFFNYYDALLTIDENGEITELARTNPSQSQLTPPEIQPSSSFILVDQGRVTINSRLAPMEFLETPAFVLAEYNGDSIPSKSPLEVVATPVPEPSVFLGIVTTLGLILGFKRKPSRTPIQ